MARYTQLQIDLATYQARKKTNTIIQMLNLKLDDKQHDLLYLEIFNLYLKIEEANKTKDYINAYC